MFTQSHALAAYRGCLASVVVALALPSSAWAVHFWQDPVILHTNGMRLASSTSQRGHNVYWQPDPGHVGYCDGVMYGPCKNELRGLGKRPACYPLPAGPTPRATTSDSHHAFDGMEYTQGERLGVLPIDEIGTPRAALLSAASVTEPRPSSDSTWDQSLQTLQDKMLLSEQAAAEQP